MPFTWFSAERHCTSWYFAASARAIASVSASAPPALTRSATCRVVGFCLPRSKRSGAPRGRGEGVSPKNHRKSLGEYTTKHQLNASDPIGWSSDAFLDRAPVLQQIVER